MLAPGASSAQQRCEGNVSLRSVPTERFEDNGDGTVTDRQSKLMWSRCSAGQQWTAGSCSGQAGTYTFDSAKGLARDVNQTGTYFYKDWRLPRLPELATLIERQCANPRTNLVIFPNTPAGSFWTETSRPGSTDGASAYALSFDTEGVLYQGKDERSHVRLVRRSQ